MSRPQKYRARKHLKEVRSMTQIPLLRTPLSPSAPNSPSALFPLFTTARPLIITPNDRS